MSLLIHAYPLLTDELQSPYCSLTNPLQILLPSFFLYLKYCASLMYIKPLELREAQVKSPPQ